MELKGKRQEKKKDSYKWSSCIDKTWWHKKLGNLNIFHDNTWFVSQLRDQQDTLKLKYNSWTMNVTSGETEKNKL